MIVHSTIQGEHLYLDICASNSLSGMNQFLVLVDNPTEFVKLNAFLIAKGTLLRMFWK